jgi:protoheme ferro-lyase
MTIGVWAAMLTAGVACGASACAGLVVPRRWLWAAGACGVVSIAGLVLSLVGIWTASGGADTRVASAFIALGACGGGFALAAALLPSVARSHAQLPALKPGPEDGRVHLIILADAEPETYSPSSITATLQMLADTGVPLPPDSARALVYASERARYHSLGHSPARPQVRALAAATSLCLEGRGVPGQVAVAFCEGEATLAQVMAVEVGEGARRVVVAQASVAERRALDKARRALAALRLDESGVAVHFAPPLWASAEVGSMLARRIVAAFDNGPTETDGVVLVSEGEPPQWRTDFPLTSEQSTFFAQRVRSELVDMGFAEDLVRPAWLEWDEPEVTEVLRHLAAVGCERIVVVPATIMFDTVETSIDLKVAADRAAFESGVTVAVLSAWGDDETVVGVLCDAIGEAAAEFDETLEDPQPGDAR